MALNRSDRLSAPRQRRQAIFLGATEPRAARPETTLPRSDASRPRQVGGVNQRCDVRPIDL